MSINQNKNHHENLSPKRLVYTAPSGNTGGTSRAGSAETPAAPSAAPAPTPTNGQSLEIIQLRDQLSGTQERSQAAAERLLGTIHLQTTHQQLTQYFRSQSTTRPAPVSPSSANQSATERAGSMINRAGEYIHNLIGSISGMQLSPEQKAVEFQRQIIDRIKDLQNRRVINVPQERIDTAYGHIASRYNELMQQAPHWTKENSLVVAAAAGVLLFNIIRKKSLWEGTKSTAKFLFWGGVVPGVAVYAAKELAPNTKVGEVAQSIWDRFYYHVPGITQHEDRRMNGSAPSTSTEQLREVASVQRLRDLIHDYRSVAGFANIDRRGNISDRNSLATLIRDHFSILKERQEYRQLLANVTLSNPPTRSELNNLQSALENIEASEYFRGNVPSSIRNILHNRAQMRDMITNDDDIPRNPEADRRNFQRTIEAQSNETVRKINDAKGTHNSYYERMRSTVLYWKRQYDGVEAQKRDLQQQINRMVASDKAASGQNRERLMQRLQDLNGFLDDANGFITQYTESLSQTPEQIYNDLSTSIINAKTELMAERSTDSSVRLHGRRAKLEQFYDRVLGVELAVVQSSQNLSANVMDPSFADQALTGGVLVGAVALGLRYQGIRALMGVGARTAAAPFRAFGHLAVNNGNRGMQASRLGLVTQIKRNPIMATGNALLLGAAAVTSVRNAYDAYHQIQMMNLGVEGVATTERTAIAALGATSALVEGGMIIGAMSRFRNLATVKNINVRRYATARDLVLLVGIETGGALLREWLQQNALRSELENISFGTLPDNQLFALLALYGSNWSDWRGEALNAIRSYFSGNPPPPDLRIEMRQKIILEFARRSGVPESNRQLALDYYRHNRQDYDHESSDEDREMLQYAIFYAHIAGRITDNEVFDRRLTNHTAMKTRIDEFRSLAERRARGEEMRRRMEGEMALSPEMQYLFRSLGSYDQVMRFYELCGRALANTTTPPNPDQRGKLERYQAEATIYIQRVLGGYQYLSPRVDQSATYQTIETFMRNALNESPQTNGLLHYHAASNLLSRLTGDTNEISIDAASIASDPLRQMLINEGARPEIADTFLRLFFGNYVYKKGAADGLLHRQQGGNEQVFLAGTWRNIEANENTTWNEVDNGSFKYLHRRVDGVNYYYVSDLNCFFANIQMPGSFNAFVGSIEEGRYQAPEINTREVGLTVHDIPLAVMQGFDQVRSS